MKYIYFDCYAGFDLQMALGALIDMNKDSVIAEDIAKKLVFEVQLFTENVKRQSMDALLAYIDFPPQDESDINTLVDELETDENIKFMLKRWLSLKDDGKRHVKSQELKELVYCFLCMELIKQSGAEKVYISSVSQGSGVIQNGASIDFIPSKHTELLMAMAGIPSREIDVSEEIFTASSLAFLYVLGAQYLPPKAHDVIKSGYGAGGRLLSVPNIARCILARDDTDDASLGFECIFSEFSSEFADAICEAK